MDVKKEDKKKGVLVLDTNTTLLVQLEALTKQLVRATIILVNVNLVQMLHYNFYGEGRVNGNCVPKIHTEEA